MPEPDSFDAMRPAVGWLRLVRSLAVALVCSVTAAVAHLSAGGIIPTSSFTILFAGALAIAWLVSARRVTPGQLVGLLLLCQVCVHLGCSMGSMEMSAAMLTTHLAATVVSAAVMTRGEAFVWTVADRLGLRLVPHVFLVPDFQADPVPMPVSSPRSLKDVRLVHSRVLRGPPYGSS